MDAADTVACWATVQATCSSKTQWPAPQYGSQLQTANISTEMAPMGCTKLSADAVVLLAACRFTSRK
jgi:hypothetical protein